MRKVDGIAINTPVKGIALSCWFEFGLPISGAVEMLTWHIGDGDMVRDRVQKSCKIAHIVSFFSSLVARPRPAPLYTKFSASPLLKNT